MGACAEGTASGPGHLLGLLSQAPSDGWHEFLYRAIPWSKSEYQMHGGESKYYKLNLLKTEQRFTLHFQLKEQMLIFGHELLPPDV